MGITGRLLNIVDEPVCAFDKHFNVIVFNEKYQNRAKNLFGTDLNKGMNISELIRDQNEQEKIKHFLERSFNGEQFTIRESSSHHGGQKSEYDLEFVPLYDEDKKIDAAAILIKDLTVKRFPEEQIHEIADAERIAGEFKTLVENSQDVIARFDRNCRYIFVNSAIEKPTGFLPQHFIGKHVFDVGFPKEQIEPFQEKLQAAFITKQTQIYFSPLNTPNGVKYPNSLIIPEFNENGNVETVLMITRDLTPIKEAEGKLLEIKNKYETLIRNTPDIIARFDKDHRFIFINQSPSLKKLGIDHTVLGKTPEELGLPAEPVQQFMEILRRTFKGLQQEKLISVTFEENRTVHFHPLLVPEYDETGEVETVLCITRDVTELKKAEQELKNIREFVLLSEVIPDIVWSSNSEGRVEYLNKKWYEYTGLSEKKALNNPNLNLEIVHPDDLLYTGEVFAGSKKNKTLFEVEHRLKDRNNQYNWFLTRAFPMQDEQGNVMKWIGTSTNIEKLKRLEQMLRQKAEDFITITETIPQIIWTTSPGGEITYFNQRWFNYTGLTAEQTYNENWIKAIHPEDIETVSKEWHESLKNGVELNIAHRIKNTKGDYQWFISRAIPVKNEKDEVIRWFGSTTDINDQKKAEKQKSEFMNIASHELKTPLTSIKAYVELSLSLFEGEHPDKTLIRNYITKASNSIERLNKLVSDLLDVSRIESGKMDQFEVEKIDWDRFVKEVVEDFQYMSPAHPVKMEGQTGQCIIGNRLKLEQVITNLLSNAVKFSPEGREVIVVLKKNSDKEIQLSVSDKGRGISGSHLDKIFDRFYRIKDYTNATGMGLGLFISKEIIIRHHGKIWAESEKNKGSVISFCLPCAD